MSTAALKATVAMARRIAVGEARGQRSRQSQCGPRDRCRMRGMALLMVLLAVALLALATTLPLQLEVKRQQRERELDLLFAGRAIRAALASYHAATPGPVKQYPQALDDLLLDRRSAAPRRHLRQLYRDPFTGLADWTLLREQGAIVGIASRSDRAPLLRTGFAADEAGFADAARLADWQFIHRPGAAGAGPVAGPTPAPMPAPAPAPGIPEPPAAPIAPTPPAPPSQRADCLRQLSLLMQACLLSTAPDCRTRAREQYRACLS